MQVCYTSCIYDSSGYSEAARNNVIAMDKAGIDLVVKPITFERFKCDIGTSKYLLDRLVKKEDNSKVQIIHMTPAHYTQFINPMKYNIGYAAWETSLLPKDWVVYINRLQEIWVPSSHNVEVFKNSGVTIPIIQIPHAFNIDKTVSNKSVIEHRENEFVFYSIAQWLERKNLVDLLKAYFTEFTNNENVLLVLKTFVVNPDNKEETESLKQRILHVKNTLYLDNYPKILLISNLLNTDQIWSLHNEGNCYVALPKCEGFSVCCAEAMLNKKPVITTGYGGQTDFIKHNQTGFLVDYRIEPVSSMPWDIYKGWMSWASPDIMSARKYMRYVYKHQEEAKQIGENGYQYIVNNLSWEKIGNLIKERLSKIEEIL